MAKPHTSKSRAEALLTRVPWTLLGISRSTWKRLEADGLVPLLVAIPGLHNPRWRVADLRNWLASQKPDRRKRVRNGAAPAAVAYQQPVTT